MTSWIRTMKLSVRAAILVNDYSATHWCGSSQTQTHQKLNSEYRISVAVHSLSNVLIHSSMFSYPNVIIFDFCSFLRIMAIAPSLLGTGIFKKHWWCIILVSYTFSSLLQSQSATIHVWCCQRNTGGAVCTDRMLVHVFVWGVVSPLCFNIVVAQITSQVP